MSEQSISSISEKYGKLKREDGKREEGYEDSDLNERSQNMPDTRDEPEIHQDEEVVKEESPASNVFEYNHFNSKTVGR